MTRSVTAALLTELGNPITTPAYFVEILFATPLRLSSRGTINWNGNLWQSRNIVIRGLTYDLGAAKQDGNLSIGDTDNSITTLILQQGIGGRTINIWKWYGVAPAAADPVQIFAGAGDSVSMDERSAGVNIALVQRSARELYTPRRLMTRANGFSLLPVIGKAIWWNGETIKLARER